MRSTAALLFASLALLPTSALAGGKGQTVEVSLRSSPGPVCRALRSTFVVEPATGPDSVPTLRDTFAPPVQVTDDACGVRATFRDDTRSVDVSLGDGGSSILAPITEGSSKGRAFRPTERSVQLRGAFGDAPWRTVLSAADLTTIGVPSASPSYLDVSTALPIVVRVRRCVGSVCEAYHQVDTAAATPTCTPGLELHLLDDTLAVTNPSLQRCLPDSDGVALAVFATPSTDRPHTLSVSVPGYDLPALLIELPRTEAQLLSIDVRVQQD